jgi:hypothetical protein
MSFLTSVLFQFDKKRIMQNICSLSLKYGILPEPFLRNLQKEVMEQHMLQEEQSLYVLEIMFTDISIFVSFHAYIHMCALTYTHIFICTYLLAYICLYIILICIPWIQKLE